MLPFAAIPFTGMTTKLNTLNKIAGNASSQKMPVLFVGHGNPMNAIQENEFVQGFRAMAQRLPQPSAILCISAHWETKGTWITAMEKPKTIHDFGGFPKELYEVQYPAPGSPLLAKQTSEMIRKTTVGLDEKWGLDHGAWSVIKHLYPQADVPVVEMSLDYGQGAAYHYDLAKELNALRSKGVLIIGSGNIVHNLRMVEWSKMYEHYAFDWAQEANEKMKHYVLNHDHSSLINYSAQGKSFQLAIPSPEHYLPLLYTLALQDKNETVELFNDKPLAGSLSMTSFRIG
ncbi:MAG: LigB family dioxygenase [Bacteroidetes bacterium ADurb.Bin141]|nr:MAG: aromatic ring-cleaving dioxygenase [Bacteroidetes bacterium OLB10]MBV6453520.1 4,5-DOPA dioxygenase extradiol [Bacteroidia bacterium]OQB59467.1 MAG: LigB family dioxygenase [Bacteroidetes bacterium ADurb.Bin141]